MAVHWPQRFTQSPVRDCHQIYKHCPACQLNEPSFLAYIDREFPRATKASVVCSGMHVAGLILLGANKARSAFVFYKQRNV